MVRVEYKFDEKRKRMAGDTVLIISTNGNDDTGADEDSILRSDINVIGSMLGSDSALAALCSLRHAFKGTDREFNNVLKTYMLCKVDGLIK